MSGELYSASASTPHDVEGEGSVALQRWRMDTGCVSAKSNASVVIDIYVQTAISNAGDALLFINTLENLLIQYGTLAPPEEKSDNPEPRAQRQHKSSKNSDKSKPCAQRRPSRDHLSFALRVTYFPLQLF